MNNTDEFRATSMRAVQEQPVKPNKLSLSFSQTEVEGSISDRLQCVVKHYPNNCAIKVEHHRLTYAEMDDMSNRVASAILDRNGEGAEPVALLIEDGIAPIIALLGVLKTGKFYVALAPSTPHARLLDILRDIQPGLIVTNRQYLALAMECAQSDKNVLNLDECDTGFSNQVMSKPFLPNALAAICYTSGSTGKPKGILLTHRNILHTARNDIHNYHIEPGDHHSLLFSYSFAASTSDLFDTLLSGAVLYPYDVRNNGLSQLANWLIQEEISLLHPPLQLFRQFLRTLHGSEHFSKVKLVRLGGQSVYTRDIANIRMYFSRDCTIVHRFSSTEAGGMIAQLFINERWAERARNVIPVGYVPEDQEVFIVDEEGQTVGRNEIGEITVRSRYLSPGYWNQRELTRQKFLPDPEGGDKRIYLTGDLGRMRPDGCLEHLGRKDFQVKIRGYRIELAEIEAVLYALEEIREAVVAAPAYQNGEKRLVAYIVPYQHPGPSVEILRTTLQQNLPQYMLPSYFVFLDQLPLTPTGKVDLKALPEPDWQRPQLATPYVTPRDELECRITTLCEEILGISPIGIDDDFADLGMDSLQYLRFWTEFEQRILHRPIPGRFFQAATVRQIADLLSSPKADEHVPERPDAESLSRSLQRQKPLPKFERILCLSVVQKLLPYSIGCKFLAWFCRTRWAQHHYFHPDLIVNMQTFLALIGRTRDEDRIVQQYLLSNFMHVWRVASLVHGDADQFDSWVTVKGASILDQSIRNGRGVIFAGSHFGPKRILTEYLDRSARHDVIHLLGGRHAGNVPERFRAQGVSFSHQTYLGLHQPGSLYQAIRCLERGGIVRIAADGYGGENELVLPFFDRQRPFKTGFAELAVMTGATVLPVFTTLDLHGQIVLHFLDPFPRPAEPATHQAQVEYLVRQYASLLERSWREEPGNINMGQLKKFFRDAS